MISLGELHDIANWKDGLISPAVHFDAELYRQEQERVFGRAWLVVGHEDMVRKPGDYITNYMGEVPVILVRDTAGKIHVLVNRCAHRGNQVCLFDRGRAPSFTCSYHGWAYGLDGKLMGVPMEQELYRGELKKEDWGLEEVARVTNFKGLIFASFDASAPSLEDWLGEDGCWWLETVVLVDHLGGLEALPGWHRYRSPGNWKLLAENFIGDDYHVMTSHGAYFKVVRDFAEKGTPIRIVDSNGIRARAYEGTAGYGHGCPMGMGMVSLDDAVYENDLVQAKRLGPAAVEWVRDRYHRHLEALKDREIKPYSFMNGLIFPNMGLMGFYSPLDGRHWLLFQPRGVWEHEIWQWTMVEREAPRVVKEAAAEYVYQGQHMAGMIAPDDVENFERLVEAMRDPRSWRRPFNYSLQLGHEQEGPHGLPGNLGPNPSEANQRNFFRFWLELMERS
jgi:phenylpropionate dioxygenase-like ring-hydroxylating dioxygenase large terminal subunit